MASRRKAIVGGLGAIAGAGALYHLWTRRPSAAAVRERLAGELASPTGPISVYHLGHSLVNRDMPAMLAQLAPPGHRYDSQLGWGTSLKAHWGDAEIDGFEAENAHSRFRPAHEAVDSGEYDAIVLTEMVEIRDAIRYFDSAAYLALWAEKAIAARADVRLYLYETWHRLDDPDDWLERLDRDLDRYWLRQVLGPALQELPQGTRINLIPAGQVLAAFVRVIEAQGGVDNIRDRTDLFARGSDGAVDPIHLNDMGNYLVSLVHFTVLYHASPVGLPTALQKADGAPALAPGARAARLMQETTARIVVSLGLSGIAA